MHVLGLAGIAMAIGVVSVIQSATNGVLASRIGLGPTVLINALVVLAGATTLWLATRGNTSVAGGPTPWFLFLGGVYGITFLVCAAFVFPRLGAGPTTALMVAAQLCLALAFDHFGIPMVRVPVTPWRVLGAVLLLVGAVMVLWPKLRA